MRLINIQYILIYLKKFSNFVRKNSRYINVFNKYKIRIILFKKLVLLSGKIRYINTFNKYTIRIILFEKN